jgi:glycosyltransferase involved in cell wall biosynthesis
MEDWDDQWRRNQFVCAELGRRQPNRKILFLGVPRNLTRLLAAGEIGTILRSPITKVPGHPNITVTRALRVGLERFAAGIKLNQSITRHHLLNLSRRLELHRPVLWLNPHYATHLIGRMNESSVIYDITDDWISRDQPPWLADQTRRQDEEMCKKANAVIVCSQRLYEMKQPLAAGKLHLIPNGVDAEHYRAVLEGNGPLSGPLSRYSGGGLGWGSFRREYRERGQTPKAIALPPAAALWKKPVFGYTGTVHTDRLDVDLVESVARRLTAGTIVFLGPDHLPSAVRQRLEKTGRVVFHDAVPYEHIPQFMRAFDVCITPHRISPFVQSLQPIKLWEYLASGKPIVATPVSGFRDFPDLVRLAETAEDFAAQLAAAAAEGSARAPERQAVARDNSWLARVDDIERVLDLVSRT